MATGGRALLAQSEPVSDDLSAAGRESARPLDGAFEREYTFAPVPAAISGVRASTEEQAGVAGWTLSGATSR